MAFLTPDQLTFFETEGYLVIENLLSEQEIDAMWDEYAELLDRVATQFFAEGRISSTYSELPFDERYCAIFSEDKSIFEHLNISMPVNEVRYEEGAFAPVHCGQQVFNLLTNPKILDIAESILGPEIYSNPIQHIRMKVPASSLDQFDAGHSYHGATLWHQDQAALNPRRSRYPAAHSLDGND